MKFDLSLIRLKINQKKKECRTEGKLFCGCRGMLCDCIVHKLNVHSDHGPDVKCIFIRAAIIYLRCSGPSPRSVSYCCEVNSSGKCGFKVEDRRRTLLSPLLSLEDTTSLK